jgi:hypothetical protein
MVKVDMGAASSRLPGVQPIPEPQRFTDYAAKRPDDRSRSPPACVSQASSLPFTKGIPMKMPRLMIAVVPVLLGGGIATAQTQDPAAPPADPATTTAPADPAAAATTAPADPAATPVAEEAKPTEEKAATDEKGKKKKKAAEEEAAKPQ